MYFFAINESRVEFATYEEAKAAREQAMDDAGYFSPWPTTIKTLDASGKTVEVESMPAPIHSSINVDEDEE